MNFRCRFWLFASLAALLFSTLALLTVRPVAAQSGYGEITGLVSDPSGAVVPGASVILSNPSTGENRKSTTNAAGAYRFTAVPIVGSYSIAVTAQGFAPYRVDNLTISVGAVTTQDIKLSVGGTNSTVLVNAGNEPDVQLTTSSVSQLIDENTWKSQPLEVRTQNAFVTLTAGAVPDNVTGRGASVDGARTGTGNFMADGYDNNDQGQGGAGTAVGGGGAVVTISPDALQEYRVLSHDNPAEYGKSGGFATDTVMRSGTNSFHGSLFEYNRIQALAAEHMFNGAAFNGGTALKDALVRNQFGGSFGGPIWKDRTFFFATVEFHRLRTGGPVTGTAVTSDFVNFVNSGAFEKFNENDTGQAQPADGGTPTGGLCYAYNGAACPGKLSHSGALGSVYQKLYAAEKHNFPFATSNFSSAGQGWYSGETIDYPVNVYGTVSLTQAQSTNQERASFRLDHKFTDKDALAATYLVDRADSTYEFGGGGNTLGPDETNPADAQLFGITWTHIFNATTTNQVRASYLRHSSDFYAPGTAGVPMIITAVDPLTEGFGAYSGLPQTFTENQFQYQENLTKVIADHTLAIGGEFRRTRNGSSFYNDVYGTFYPYDVENLLTDGNYGDDADQAIFGAPTYGGFYETSAAIDSTTNAAPDPYRGYRANEVAMYIQDDWRVNHRLSLNAGLRWEYFGPPHNFEPNIDSNVYWGAGVTPVTGSAANGNPLFPITSERMAQIATATFQIRNHDIWNKDLNNFSPRLGLAYDLTGSGKYVIRAGASIGYDRIYNNVFENIRFNPPHYADNTFGAESNGVVAGPMEQPNLYNAPFSGNSQYAAFGGKPVPRHIDQDLVTPYYEGAHFGIETALGHGYVLETNYVATRGRKLIGLSDVNNYDGRTACSTTSPSAACIAAGYPKGFASARPNPLFNSDNFRSNNSLSNYNGLQASLKKHYASGLQFTANYTYSKALDEISDVFTTRSGQTGITDPENPRYDYGPADFDIRQALVVNGIWETKWKPQNLILGGWSLSGILSRYTGSPIPLTDSASSNDPNKDGRFVDRPMFAPGYAFGSKSEPGVQTTNAGGAETITFLNPKAFQDVTCGTALWCNSPMKRNQFFGPAFANLDLGVLKSFRVTESTRFRYEANFFNFFNHPNLNNPGANTNSGTFGQITSSRDPRVTQMALRYEF
ncbi:MAG TPA: carboxypeptidase regulatory-like domain-containing protein [Acidobacteriaceae bacterium]|nr:carboxypeptidase regulatory-like domain-containing protein [Acidobacteriaceae bacterium]